MSKRKKYISWIIAIIAIVGAVFYFRSDRSKIEYTTADVTRGSVIQTVSVTGELVAENKVDLAFRTSGRLRTVTVDVGDQVVEGQLLGSIEPGVLNAQFKQAQEQVDYQKETLANMKKREDTYNGFQRDAQRAQIRAAEENVNTILAQFGDLRLFSPIDGVVLKRSADPGEIVSITGAVLSIGNPEKLIIESNIPESDIVKIALDQKADVTFDAFSLDEKFEAKVTEIEPSSTVIQDVVYYKVKLILDSVDDRFRDGMSVDIDINIEEKNNVLMVPQRAVKSIDGTKKAQILIGEDEVQDVEVSVGLRGDDGAIEVVSGLEEGQKVITFIGEK